MQAYLLREKSFLPNIRFLDPDCPECPNNSKRHISAFSFSRMDEYQGREGRDNKKLNRSKQEKLRLRIL